MTTTVPRADGFKLFLRAVDQYIAELELIAQQTAAKQPDTAKMVRAFAEHAAGMAIDLLTVWPTDDSAADGR